MRHPAVCGFVLSLVLWGCGEDDRPASWHYIHAAVIKPNCTTSSCHTAFNAAAGVKLHDAEAAYIMLTGRPCPGALPPPPQEPDRNFVFPGQPERSRLMYLLRGEEVRRQMPPDRPLPEVDIELVERWILEGAECN